MFRALSLSAALSLTACPAVSEVAIRATEGLPQPGECVPGMQRCAPLGGGTVPVVCSHVVDPLSHRHREWPSLPLTGTGEQRTCGRGGCAVNDAGVAHCTLDAGGDR